jgi:hypothetical protein
MCFSSDVDPAYVIATLSPLTWPLWTTVGALIHSRRVRRRHGDLLELWIRWWLLGGMALGALTIAVTFWIVPGFMAGSMGYATGPYQLEVSFTNLAFAVMAVLCVRQPAARVVVLVGFAVFMWGAALGHLDQAVAHHNLTPGNTGGILVYDLGLPALLLVLVLRQRHRDALDPVTT